MSLERMREIVREQLSVIDDIMAARNVRLIHRPFEAAVLFVNECIIEIKGDTKEDFLEKRWFADIYEWVEAWYVDRYGSALTKKHEEHEESLVVIFGMPFRVKVPLTICKPDRQGETIWVMFPTSVKDDEELLGWIDAPPNLQNLSIEDVTKLKQDIREVATSIRSIRVNFMTADLESAQLSRLGGSISSHLRKAVGDILAIQPDHLSMAFWEMHLAIEKTIKLYLRQRGISPPNSHDLLALNVLAEAQGEFHNSRAMLYKLPTAEEAIRCRYGENDDITLDRAIKVYQTTIGLINQFSKALNRTFVFDNAEFLIKAPPWKKPRSE
jgi:hypothetical protein